MQAAACKGAKRVAGYFRAAKEYSYRSKQAAGDGWVLVGDAFGFLDPLYSSGVLLALEVGPDGRRRHRRGPEPRATPRRPSSASGRPASSGAWTACGGWSCEYYDGFSFGGFVRKYPHLKRHLTDLLIGDLFNDKVDAVWGRSKNSAPRRK